MNTATEAAARAIYVYRYGRNGAVPGTEAEFDNECGMNRARWESQGEAALAAAVPLILEDLAERIEDECRSSRDACFCGSTARIRSAAAEWSR